MRWAWHGIRYKTTRQQIKKVIRKSKAYYQNYDNMWQFRGQVNNLGFSPSLPNYSGGTTFNCESHKERRWQGGKTLRHTKFSTEWLPLINASCSECHRLSQKRASSSSSSPTPQQKSVSLPCLLQPVIQKHKSCVTKYHSTNHAMPKCTD